MLVQSSARRRGGSNVAICIERHRTHRIVRRQRAGELGRRLQLDLLLSLLQPFYLAWNHQLGIVDQLNAMLFGKVLRALGHKINMRRLL